jgi:hypothetical protein
MRSRGGSGRRIRSFPVPDAGLQSTPGGAGACTLEINAISGFVQYLFRNSCMKREIEMMNRDPSSLFLD